MMNELNKKVSYKRVRPNPLFEDWLEILYNEAKQKKSKLEPMLQIAMDSIAKYPLTLQSGSECIILKGFGKELCEYFNKCLEKHNTLTESSRHCNTKNGDYLQSTQSVLPTISPSLSSSSSSEIFNKYIPQSNDKTTVTSQTGLCNESPQISGQVGTASNLDIDSLHVNCPYSNADCLNPPNSARETTKTNAKKYKPAVRSGGFAILVGLLENYLENPDRPSLTKEELIERAQKHSEESFIRPKPESHYTAWSNMSRLVTKGLVSKTKAKKVEYLLTEQGKELAETLIKEISNGPSLNDVIFNNVNVPSTSDTFQEQVISSIDEEEVNDIIPSSSQSNTVVLNMPPESFDIILLIDKNETGGLKKKNDPTVAQFNKYEDLKHEYRSLKVGDFTWIARHKVNKDLEFVLPYILERKRMDDLGASLKDGRFHEQKFRLKKCGLKNVIYLVENYGKNKNVGLPLQHLMQALANTRVQDEFKVHITDSLNNSVRFLAMMTKRLTIRFKNKHLQGRSAEPSGNCLMTFEYFNKSSAKTKPLTVTEIFIKLLLQLKGLSVEKALAITEKYPTPNSLISAYLKCDSKEGEWLLAHLKFDDLNRNVGPVTSRAIYQLFS